MEENFYGPEDDTFMMIDCLKKFTLNKKIKNSLEIGVGNGEISKFICEKSEKHTGTDINPYAIKQTKKICHKGKYILSNMFEKIKGKFDLIIFNPPYLPEMRGEDDDWIKKAIVGGKKGYELIINFLDQVEEYLSEEGSCFILFSSQSKPKIILDKLEELLFDKKLVKQKSILMEEIFIYKITKSEFLKNLNKLGYKKIKYFAKGKHGIVYTALKNNIKYAIKTKNKNSFSEKSIENEAEKLKFVNSLNIGPKFKDYDKKNNFVSYEFVEGEHWNKEYELLNKKDIQKIILNIFNQCHKMDLAGFEKKEMTRPNKNVIISNKKPVLIDFERGVFKDRCSNVTQLIQYLKKSKFSNYIKNKFKINFSDIDLKLIINYSKNNKKYFKELKTEIIKCFE